MEAFLLSCAPGQGTQVVVRYNGDDAFKLVHAACDDEHTPAPVAALHIPLEDVLMHVPTPDVHAAHVAAWNMPGAHTSQPAPVQLPLHAQRPALLDVASR